MIVEVRKEGGREWMGKEARAPPHHFLAFSLKDCQI